MRSDTAVLLLHYGGSYKDRAVDRIRIDRLTADADLADNGLRGRRPQELGRDLVRDGEGLREPDRHIRPERAHDSLGSCTAGSVARLREDEAWREVLQNLRKGRVRRPGIGERQGVGDGATLVNRIGTFSHLNLDIRYLNHGGGDRGSIVTQVGVSRVRFDRRRVRDIRCFLEAAGQVVRRNIHRDREASCELAGMVPRLQINGVPTQLTELDAKFTPAGRVSVTSALTASEGPKFVTAMV